MANKKPVIAAVTSIKEEAKLAAAAEASARRAKGRKGKGALKYYFWVGLGVASVLFAIFLAFTGDSTGGKRGGTSKASAQVNDRSFIRGVMADAGDNFTAAASPFFDKWTYDDVKWGLDGVGLYGANMLGMAGALQACEKDDATEGGVLPSVYDVRDAWPGCVVEVMDSGNCSSSYAIAAASSLSSRFCIADNTKYMSLKLSPQQVLSCDKNSKGCKGGGVDSVWGYIQRRGLYPESCLPYAGAAKAPCKTECDESKKLKAVNHCMMSGEKALKRELYNRGPIVAPVYIKDDFLVYESGVYSPTDNSKQQYGAANEPILQAVTVIGWGKSQGTKYWIIQGSWGAKWGEGGYARVAVDTVLRENYALVGYPATDEAIAEAAKKKEEQDRRREEAKKERAAREERIKEARKKRDEEEKAAKEEADLAELDSDEDFEEEIQEVNVDDAEM